VSAVRLIVDYDAAVAALLGEIEATGEGDRIALSVYIIEPGDSSQQVLAALAAAAERGVEVAISVDATASSKLSRLWERTRTLLPEARRLAREFPERVTARGRREPDHSKYALFHRRQAPPTALLGGVNLGDRFRPWRDFMVRVAGAGLVADLEARLDGQGEAPGVPLDDGAVAFAVNVPRAKRFEIRGVLDALAADPRFVRYQVAMAYLDRTGAEVLRTMLGRGARVELVMPSRANVYQHANMRALGEVLARAPALEATLHPAMLHAKALVAWDDQGRRTAFVGSANLKRNSFRMLGELNAVVCDPAFTADLSAAIAALAAGGTPLREPPPYSRAMAAVEERLG